MRRGFFSNSELPPSSKPIPGMSRCGACGLHKSCNSPRMKPFGKNRKNILVVAEAPGQLEDRKNTPLIGESGQLLRKRFKRIGINLDIDCLTTYAIRCHIPKGTTPTRDKIDACFPSLWKTIKETNPTIIILLGSVATEAVIRHTWKGDFGGINRWAGWTIPSQKPNAWICPTWHPSYLLQRNSPTLTSLFDEHLEAAVEKSVERPWKRLPEYAKDVEILLTSPETTAASIHKMAATCSMAAFDYETTMLKPDSTRAEIVSCSICFDGNRTIAFPWHGDAIQATKSFLRSSVKKICANIKFEERWTKAQLGCDIRRPFWDTMQAAHILDNRRAIFSLKFQSYVLLGMPDYDSGIKPYLKSGPDGVNHVRDIPLKDLLLYNGLDSLLTYKIAMMQMEEFKPFPLPRIGV